MDGIIEWLVKRYGGALVTMLVTGAAGFLVRKGWMQPTAEQSWIAANVEWLSGALLTLVSFLLVHFRHQGKIAQIDQAAATGVGVNVNASRLVTADGSAPVTATGAGPGQPVGGLKN